MYDNECFVYALLLVKGNLESGLDLLVELPSLTAITSPAINGLKFKSALSIRLKSTDDGPFSVG